MSHSRIKKVENIPNLYIDEVSGIYLVRIYHEGQTRPKSLKTKSLSIAKQKIASAIREIVTTDKRKLRNKLVGSYYDGFWKSLLSEELSEATLLQNAGSWKNHVAPFWANVPDTQVTHDKFVEYLAWHKKNKGTTIYNALKVLRKIVSYMRKQGAVIPLVEIDVPKRERDSMGEDKGTYITESESAAIFSVPMDPRLWYMIRASYVLGFRIGEHTNLKRDRVKIINGDVQIHLRAQDTKTRKARVVPLTKELSAAMLEILASHNSRYVFHAAKSTTKPTSKQVVERAWKGVLRDAGIRRSIRFHDLRHTAATNMAELDIDPVKACAILGMSLKIYMSTYVKKHKLNLTSVTDLLSQNGGRP